jgi:SpoVK/Ycf46/Vps4 family AAA+-type ATPase
VLASRSDSDHESSRRLKNEFLTAMEGVSSGEGVVLFVGATNMPWQLDPAALRRFSKKLYIPLPGEFFSRIIFNQFEHISDQQIYLLKFHVTFSFSLSIFFIFIFLFHFVLF